MLGRGARRAIAGITPGGLLLATEEPNFALGQGIPYYTCGHSAGNTGSTKVLTLGTIWAVPFYLAQAARVQRIAAQVVGVGTAGSALRFGLYDANPRTNGPLNRIVDSGDHDGTSLGIKETVGLDFPLAAGRVYWAAITAGIAAPNMTAMTGATTFGEQIIGKNRAALDTAIQFIIRLDGQLWANRLPAVWPGGGARTAENNTWPAVFIRA